MSERLKAAQQFLFTAKKEFENQQYDKVLSQAKGAIRAASKVQGAQADNIIQEAKELIARLRPAIHIPKEERERLAKRLFGEQFTVRDALMSAGKISQSTDLCFFPDEFSEEIKLQTNKLIQILERAKKQVDSAIEKSGLTKDDVPPFRLIG